MCQYLNEMDSTHAFMYERLEAQQKRIDELEDLGYELNIWLDFYVNVDTDSNGKLRNRDRTADLARQAVEAWDQATGLAE